MQSVTAGSIDFQTIPYVGDDARRRTAATSSGSRTRRRCTTFFADLSAEPEPPAEPTRDRRAGDRRPGARSRSTSTTARAPPAWPPPPPPALQGAGLRRRPAPATPTATNYTATEIRHAAGDEALATTLAAAIPGRDVAEARGRPPPGTVAPRPRVGLQRRRRSRSPTPEPTERRSRARTPAPRPTPPASTDGPLPGRPPLAGTLAAACPTLPADLLTAALRRDAAAPLVTHYDDATGERVELSGDDAGQLGGQDGEPAAGRVRRRPGQHRRAWPCRCTGRPRRCCSAAWSCGATVAGHRRRGRRPPRRASTSSSPRRTGCPRWRRTCPRTTARAARACRCTRWAWAWPATSVRPGTSPLEVRAHGDVFSPYEPPDPAGPGLRLGGLELTLGGLGGGGRRAGRPAGHRRGRPAAASTSRSPPRPARSPGCSRRWPPAPRWCWCATPCADGAAPARGRRAGHRDPRTAGRRASGSWAGR